MIEQALHLLLIRIERSIQRDLQSIAGVLLQLGRPRKWNDSWPCTDSDERTAIFPGDG
jgi:hypothetical protein